MKWWVEWGVIVQNGDQRYPDWTKTERLHYCGADLEEAKRDALRYVGGAPNILWYDFEGQQWSGDASQTTLISKDEQLPAYDTGVSTQAFITVKWL